MNIFILEDSEERIATLQRELPTIWPNCYLAIAQNSSEGKAILRQGQKFDLLLLDHDLGGQVYVDVKEENTGSTVAKFIAMNRVAYDYAITHSMNFYGAQNITAILPDCVHIPFPVLLDYLRELANYWEV